MPDLINVGALPNDGTGDNLRAAGIKLNALAASFERDPVIAGATFSVTAVDGELSIYANGTFTINLPTAVGNKARITVKLTAAGAVTIDPFGAQTIEGDPTVLLTDAGEAITFISDNSNWWII